MVEGINQGFSTEPPAKARGAGGGEPDDYTYWDAIRAARQLVKLNNDLKSCRISLIRDGEHHAENLPALTRKAPTHARAISESLEFGAVSTAILEAALIAAYEKFGDFLSSLPAPLRSRLQEISKELSDGAEAEPQGEVAEGLQHSGDDES